MSATNVSTENTEQDSVNTANSTIELSRDKIFHILQTPRRRYILRYLQDHEGSIQMRDVAEQVAAWENNTSVQALSSKERQRVYIPLYQTHLPKLDEEGIIEYNQSRGTVKRTEVANQFDEYLISSEIKDADDEIDRPISWKSYYFGVSLLSTFLLAASFVGIPLFATLSPVVLGGSIVTMYSAVTFAQLIAERSKR
ncbi:hypothetical protein ACFFQF_29705 [Haladaptatus pallidirubidus]|uniref:DUF7344 domain-containing protein n=1 Tax=Haladaptatus pallidirubidus TaxID=1008152 RepID=A0AAV3UGX8_9EURY|nr:hypothetical protein [Haladaptatus pallidirubidus]